ncbi:MAG: hypothetical protein HKN49_03975 [Gammaproteobacteria bacterium]|nr:hypothetical protein [Gammaproteobacteria bacterium]
MANRSHFQLVSVLLVGIVLGVCLLQRHQADGRVELLKTSSGSAENAGDDARSHGVQSHTVDTGPIPIDPETAVTVAGELDHEKVATVNNTGTMTVDATPPWPPGTEDRLYQIIAEHLSKYPITSVISVECEGNVCTILLSTPDIDHVGTGVYGGMINDIRASKIGIGGASVGVVEFSPGVSVIRLRVDNIEWTEERLRILRGEPKATPLGDSDLN